ncbi:hypothetical protein RRG08_056912 [Elysia crispata]|uniref:Uncharacterized protein n=1 Tax=Elysia crispata TaxID=231223 RepID=A0AAE0Z5F4_9GAST|nr:hypothetical protein RRG08_056912 [Elysia crispata]
MVSLAGSQFRNDFTVIMQMYLTPEPVRWCPLAGSQFHRTFTVANVTGTKSGLVSSWSPVSRTFTVMLQMYLAPPDKVRWCLLLAPSSQNVYCNVTDVSSA